MMCHPVEMGAEGTNSKILRIKCLSSVSLLFIGGLKDCFLIKGLDNCNLVQTNSVQLNLKLVLTGVESVAITNACLCLEIFKRAKVSVNT